MGVVVEVGSARVDVDSAQKFIAQEWQERAPTEEYPGGFAPSAAFKDQVQGWQDLRYRLRTEIEGRMEKGSSVDPKQAEGLAHLERICFMAETDPKGSRRHEGLKMLDQGRNPSHAGLTDSQRIRNYIEEMNGNDGPSDRLTVQIDHGV